jgi:diguanylate cyclase (GGDEF)-like protein/PAS domain S-box-containing protein
MSVQPAQVCVAIVTSDLENLRDLYEGPASAQPQRYYPTVSRALFELLHFFDRKQEGAVLLVLPLEELAAEPGNAQHRLLEFCREHRVVILGGLSPRHELPDFIHPIIIDDIVQFPFARDELVRRIQWHADFVVLEGQARRSHALLQGVADAMLAVDSSSRVAWANAEAAGLLGCSVDDLLGSDLRMFFPDDAGSEVSQAIKRPSTSGSWRSVRVRAQRRLAELFFVECTIKSDPSSLFHAIVVLRDVTEQRAREAALQLSAKVFEYSGEAIMITDGDDRIISVNDSFTQVTGYRSDEVVGRQPHFLSAGRQGEDFYRRMWDIVHSEGHWKGEVWNRKRDGEVYAEWLAVSAVRNDQGEVDHYISIFSDITERKIREEHIAHHAFHDFLTGLPNRVLLEDRFGQAVAVTRREGHHLAVLFLDLDGFKAINDGLGHRIGDALLCAVAEKLRRSVRASDTVSRFGGDEFVCLLVELPTPDTAFAIAESILKTLQEPIEVDDHSLSLTASIGLGFFPEDGVELETLMRKADAAMYDAKRTGRNRYCVARANAE